MSFITRPTITETFLERVRATPDLVGFQFKPTDPEIGPVDEWKQVSFKTFFDETRLVSFGLLGLGIRPKDKVAILSGTRYEWSLCDMAILGAGAITIPIYASNTAADAAFILNQSEARVAIVEDGKQLNKILEQRFEDPKCLPHLEKIVVIEKLGLATSPVASATDVLSLQALLEIGKREEAKNPDLFESTLKAAKPEDVMTICYTSGTTGVPKGVMITHDNMMSVLEDCAATLGKWVNPSGEVVLSFLPFSHILGKVESMAIYPFGWLEAFAENYDKIMDNMKEVRPTLIFCVPRIFEKAHARIHSLVENGGKVSRDIFHWAFDTGQRYWAEVWAGRSPSLRESLEYSIARRAVFSRIAQRFGGRLRFAICGGAPLPREIGEFFQILGIKILEGYGLTETTAPVTLNTPDDARFGVVGKPLPEVTIKIAEDGEILVKSRKVFPGYFKMPEETSEVIDEAGWFHTGDIGHIDSDGFLQITDRKKDLIVTSGGKNVAPQKIENLAKAKKLVTQFVVHGDRRHYLTALLTLDREQVIRYANENQILFSEYSELVRNPKILGLAQKIVDEVNGTLANFETIKKFVILPTEFSVETGELTPSLKVRRSFINQRYRAELDSMYASQDRSAPGA